MAAFSRALAQPQADWPAHVVQPGFCFFDEESALQPELETFLAEGEPPLLFTLGSTAVRNSGSFWTTSLVAARTLGKRALLVGGPASLCAPDCLAVTYAPYADVFARASVVVHQGGAGTLGQALCARRPQLLVPYGWDQPDNAARAERLGVALTVQRALYLDDTAVRALKLLLEETGFTRRSREIARKIRMENGVISACAALESALAGVNLSTKSSSGRWRRE